MKRFVELMNRPRNRRRRKWTEVEKSRGQDNEMDSDELKKEVSELKGNKLAI
jgi:hypothetical protein